MYRVDPQSYRPHRRFTLDHQRVAREPQLLAKCCFAYADIAQICREFTQPRPRPARFPPELTPDRYPAKAVSASLVRQVSPDREEDCFPSHGPSSCPSHSPCHNDCADHHAKEAAEPRNHARNHVRSKTGGQPMTKRLGAASDLTSPTTLPSFHPGCVSALI